VVPAILAVIAASIAHGKGVSLRLALRQDQRFLTGGRAPAVTQWASSLDDEGRILSNTIRITLNHGAYPILNDETRDRLRVAATSLYAPGGLDHTSVLTSTRDVPMGGFEGLGSAQLSFAREVHWNRLAEIVQQDPVLWRQRHLRKEWPVVAEICDTLAMEADFHRRYSANELIRKRRV
jgi:CO/xanthine dehydrogenase Mo-binding subunit